jgi:hypothetical protein
MEWGKLAGFYLWDKGDICVFHQVHGRTQVLKLIHQNRYKEFSGCFSIFNNDRRSA